MMKNLSWKAILLGNVLVWLSWALFQNSSLESPWIFFPLGGRGWLIGYFVSRWCKVSDRVLLHGVLYWASLGFFQITPPYDGDTPALLFSTLFHLAVIIGGAWYKQYRDLYPYQG